MDLGLRHEPALATPDRGKPFSLALSLGLHVAAFFALMEATPLSLPTLPSPSPTEYQQAFAGKEDKIVWYKFRELPNIVPRSAPSVRQPPRAEVKAKQSIVSSPKNAPKRSQVVLTPVPEIDLPPPDLPNLIAVKLPPRLFTTPPDLVKPVARKTDMPETAPDVPAQPLEAATLPVDRLPAKPYTAPNPLPKPTPAAVKLETSANMTPFDAQSTLATKLPAIRLPSRPFVAPSPREAPAARTIAAATEAPSLAVNAPAAPALPGNKLPARAFAPPAASAATAKSLALPPFEGTPGDLTVAIAGLTPSAIPVTLPAASSPAQFSAGEQVRPNGATTDGAGKGLTVPDLFVRAAGEPKPDLMARRFAAPTSKEVLKEALRYGQPVIGADAPSSAAPAVPRATATRVSSAPDARFNGRDVYMMAIQMPNLTSYSGSWLMWYADRTARQSGLQPIAAPVPHRKVDPRYIPVVVEERIEGKVQLYCVIGREGNVTSIQLVHGVDDRLNRSAEEALSKWEFYPATRNGEPVEVDVVVEIPFVLAPRSGSKP